MKSETLMAGLQALTGIALAAGIIFMLLALLYFRRSRRDAFWRQRRAAGQRGFQFMSVALVMLALSAAACLITLTVSFVGDSPDDGGVVQAPSATASLSPSPPATVSLTPTASPPPPLVESPPPPLTAADPAATSTLAPVLTPTSALPITPIITPTPGAGTSASVMEIWAIDSQISADWQPLQPANQLAGSFTRLYFYITYRNIPQGTPWQSLLLKDGVVIRQQNYQWGVLPQEGSTFFFFGDEAGFPPGSYEVQISLGEQAVLLARAQFLITAP